MTSTQTQQIRTTVTDGSGYFTFTNLQPGRYDITAELEGFKKVSRQNMQLDAAASLSLDSGVGDRRTLPELVTVTAESPLLQTDVAVRKTVEAKDIELLSFQGRNPIGVAGLKAGVNGGNFNTRGFGDLGNGGYNINGSRSDENNITIDGATAIRTRSSGADHRHSERRRDSGSAGADRPTTCRSTADRAAGRSGSSPRAAATRFSGSSSFF